MIHFATGACLALMGMTDADLINRLLFDYLAPADQALVRRVLATLRENDRAPPRLIRLRHQEGGALPCTMAVYRMQDSPLLNITLSQYGNREQPVAPADGDVDAQTQLLIPNAFTKAAVASFAAEDGGTSKALTLVQMSNLQQIRAHLTEDQDRVLMTEIGAVLRQYSGPEAVAGRLAENRFGVMTPTDLADLIARDIVQLAHDLGLDQPLEVDARTLDATGFALSHPDRARLMLYALRRFAEDGIKDMDALSSSSSIVADFARDAMGRLAKLRGDLKGSRLALSFEPIHDLSTGRTHHFEVLCRINGERPGPSITFAEEVGVINDVDMAVCGMAMRELETAPGDISLAVNLSAASVSSDLFMQALMAQLSTRPSLAGRLLFEITETGRLDDLARARSALNGLRQRGFPVCLDDFGVGMASFTYVRALEFDYVKLDGSFVSRMCESHREESIVVSMLTLCRSLKVTAIAEHVETAEQVLRLRSLGCAMGQGWFFSKGMSRPKRRDIDLSSLTRPSRWTPTVQDFRA
ncbi:EAL domain-containing protein [Nitrospirillum iridis]|uniref:EAL domain-containing protein (Putative c-di-GMP-specific phosphodiesterase class I)/GGDEF domain-containing protein n=1 Tax=Nitrospirillum iridis TaxID=765888 RepID=A0A7X0EDD2_9PROT|nr:EAL domain-containing protein (putative c-di-GMP-specific phosphodiesterase class I)/GGDEF domain-containing protein [Nitrospirillum iridis]